MNTKHPHIYRVDNVDFCATVSGDSYDAPHHDPVSRNLVNSIVHRQRAVNYP